jgi:hypothetical protein
VKAAHDRVEAILAEITDWAAKRGDPYAVALVGSWARGAAREDSDIDLMFLTPDPLWFRQNAHWLNELDWHRIGTTVAGWRDADYGIVWSRHARLADDTDVEFGFGPLAWASTDPIDPGTFRVIKGGCRILYDPKNLLRDLVTKIDCDR